MKYLFLLLLILSTQTAFAQENRHAAAQVPVDSAEQAVRRFDARLIRLREALDQNNVSNMVSAHALILGDIRQTIEQIEAKSPESQRLAPMRGILEKLGAFNFDPTAPAELKPYLQDFDDFLVHLKAELRDGK